MFIDDVQKLGAMSKFLYTNMSCYFIMLLAQRLYVQIFEQNRGADLWFKIFTHASHLVGILLLLLAYSRLLRFFRGLAQALQTYNGKKRIFSSYANC